MKYLLLFVLVGCGDVQGMPFGGELPGSGGAGGSVRTAIVGTGGSGSGGTVSISTGGATGSSPGGDGGTGAVNVASLPACPDYVTQFGSPVVTSPMCGVSADGHLLYGCVGVERTDEPFDTTPCQFADPNNAYNDSHVFGCVDVRTCR